MSGKPLECKEATVRRIREAFDYLHAHPELSWQESNTTRYVADELRKFGCRVRTFANHTGAVGDLGKGGPVVAIRADMDALRQEVAPTTCTRICSASFPPAAIAAWADV